jgi:hypothetical protein
MRAITLAIIEGAFASAASREADALAAICSTPEDADLCAIHGIHCGGFRADADFDAEQAGVSTSRSIRR